MLATLVTPFLLWSAVANVATTTADAVPRWQLNGAAVTSTPAVLDQGLSLGAMAEIRRGFRAWPGFVSARLSWTDATAANQAWLIDHQQFTATFGIGLLATIGAGRLWAQVGAGATGLAETLTRHQEQRIAAANVPGGSESTFTVGPYGFAEAGVSVAIRGAAFGFLAIGPALSRILVNQGPLWRFGATARLGVAYDF